MRGKRLAREAACAGSGLRGTRLIGDVAGRGRDKWVERLKGDVTEQGRACKEDMGATAESSGLKARE